MTAELEVLVKALDAVIEARSGAEATRVQEIYESRIGDVLPRHPVFRDTNMPFCLVLRNCFLRFADS